MKKEYEANLLVTAKATAKGNMIIKAIAQTEGFTKDDSEYKEILAKDSRGFWNGRRCVGGRIWTGSGGALY